MNPLGDFNEELFEIEAVKEAGKTAKDAGFRIFDEHQAGWQTVGQTSSDMERAQSSVDGEIQLRIFVDRVPMEGFVDGTYQARYIRQTPGKQPIRGGERTAVR